MNAKPPTFSILIATRNGLRYLPYTIQSVLSQPSQDFELVVSDNYSDDGTAEYLDTISDPRFRRTKPEKLLSMLAHFEFIAAQAKGTWITILGDDDGLMPFFFEELKRLDLDKVRSEAIVFRRAYYYWEGCSELHGNKVVIYYPMRFMEYLNNRWSIFLCLASIIDYMHLPQLYTTGLIRRSFVERIKKRCGGRFFFGTSPDASAVVAFALNASQHLRCEEPAFWVGTSPKSVGFSNSSKVQKSRVEEFYRLGRQDANEMSDLLPEKVFALSNLAVFFYDALLLNPRTGWFWLSRVARNIFLAGLISKNPEYLDAIRQAYGPKLRKNELRPYLLLVGKVGDYYKRRQASINATAKSLPFLESQDRRAFPTLAEASAAVRALWDRT